MHCTAMMLQCEFVRRPASSTYRLGCQIASNVIEIVCNLPAETVVHFCARADCCLFCCLMSRYRDLLPP